MARIPAHHLQGPAGPDGVDLPSGPMQATVQALGNAMQGGLDVGGAFLKFAEDQQNLANQRDALELEAQLRDGMADIINSRIANADPRAWVQEYDAGIRKLGEQLGGRPVSEAVRDEFLSHFTNVSGRYRIQVARDALKENLRLTKMGVETEAMAARSMGDYDREREIYDGASDIFAPEELNRMHLKSRLAQREDTIRADIAADPQGVIDNPDRYGLSPGDQAQVVSQAYTSLARLKRDETEGLFDNLEGSEDLESRLEKAKHLTDDEKEEIRANYAKTQPVDLGTKIGLVDGMNYAWQQLKAGEIDMLEYQRVHDAFAQRIYALGNRDGAGTLRKRAYDLDPMNWKEDSPDAGDPGKEVLRRYQAHSAQWYSDGGYGKRTSSKYGEKVNPEVNQATLGRREDTDAAVEAFIKQNPEATWPEVRKFWEEQLDGKGDEHIQDVGIDRYLNYFGPTSRTETDEVIRRERPQARAFEIPERRGVIQQGKAVGVASTYWGPGADDNGMTSVGIPRARAPWWTEKGLPTIALAPEVAEGMGVTVPKKGKEGWDISGSLVEVTMPDGRQTVAVYAENGMYKHPNSKDKLIDLSEQFQQVMGVRRGTNVQGIQVRPL